MFGNATALKSSDDHSLISIFIKASNIYYVLLSLLEDNLYFLYCSMHYTGYLTEGYQNLIQYDIIITNT